MRPAKHPQEEERLQILRSYQALDTPPEQDFDDLVALAAEICDAPIPLLSLVDEERQWFKARYGMEIEETPRENSICAHTILQRELFEIPDLTQNPISFDNPMITGENGLRHYAGVPLESPEGFAIGTLCVIDRVPRELNRLQRKTLKVLGREAMAQLNLRRKARETDQARQEAEAAVAFLNLVVDSLPVRLAYIDKNYIYRFINDTYRTELGVTRDQVVGKHVRDAMGVAVFELAKSLLDRALAGEKHVVELITPYKSGDRWIRATYVPDIDEMGVTRGIVSHIQDVGEIHAQAEAFRAANARNEKILETAEVATFDWEINQDTVSASPLLNRLFGFTNDPTPRPLHEFIGRVHEEDRPKLVAAIEEAVTLGTRFECEYRVTDIDGDLRTILARGEVKRDEDTDVSRFSGVVLDVTQQSAVERALAVSEERFRKLIDLAPATVWTAEPGGGLTFISQDFYDATGMTPEVALPTGWASAVHPDDLPHVAHAWEEARRSNTAYDTEFRTRDKEGAYRWISARALPIRDENGVVTGWLGSNSDIHLRKAAEEDLQRAVSERTAELEDAIEEAEAFNYSMSHDLRAPLRAIAANSHILLDEIGASLSPEHCAMLARQEQSAKRLGILIDELLRLSRLGRVEVRRLTFDLTQMAHEACIELCPANPVQIDPEMTAVGDPTLVRLVLENLIGNACKFSPKGSTISIGAKEEVFWVKDRGIGFDMRYADKIFLPFERLVQEQQFPGTGIGLANVKRIIERHKGRVWAESKEGEGSTFFFTLGEGGTELN